MTDEDRKADAAMAQKGFGYSRPRGRPNLPLSQRRTNVGVMLDPGEKAQAAKIGEGNISQGVRRALKLVRTYEAAASKAMADAMAKRVSQFPPHLFGMDGECRTCHKDQLAPGTPAFCEGPDSAFD